MESNTQIREKIKSSCCYCKIVVVAFDDESNPWILMSDDLAELINTKIYLVDTFDEIERYNGYLDGIERILKMACYRVVTQCE